MILNDTRDDLRDEIVGKSDKTLRIIKINSNNLFESGDLSFSANLQAWKRLLKNNNKDPTSRNILEYYLRRCNVDTCNFTDKKIEEEAFNLLLSASRSWKLSIERACMQRDKVCLFLNHSNIIATAIKNTIKLDRLYGTKSPVGKSICLQINEDTESQLTTARLWQLKNVSEKVLIAQGYTISQDDCDYKYFLTTKSQGKIEDTFHKYVCGVVKNPETNSKESSLTVAEYLENKIEELKDINEDRLPVTDYQEIWLKTIAEAVITFEFLSVKPSQPTFIKTNVDADRGVTNNKGGAFVLYNTARIVAILNKYQEQQVAGNYPELWDIDAIDFDKLALEEEWNLVYNFILGYPAILLNSVQHDVRHELCPQVLCLFLAQLSQKFSIYYRRTRILTEGHNHLLPTMMARLYLLKALQIIVNNALDILNIVPLSRM